MFKPCVVRVLVYIIIKIINVQRIVSILLSLKSERGINKTVKSSSVNKYNMHSISLRFFFSKSTFKRIVQCCLHLPVYISEGKCAWIISLFVETLYM